MSWPSTVTVPAVGVDDAADDVDQRRLAGAVRPEQREDLAAADVEVDVLERLEAGRVIGQSPRPGVFKRRGFPVKLVVGRR